MSFLLGLQLSSITVKPDKQALFLQHPGHEMYIVCMAEVDFLVVICYLAQPRLPGMIYTQRQAISSQQNVMCES